MKIEGRYTFNLPIQEVYDALRDEDLLREALPGKVHFKMTSATHYEASMDLDVPKFKGHYAGTVDVTDTQAPYYYDLSVNGTGMGREVTAEGRVALTELEANKTEVHYLGTTDALRGYNNLVQRIAAPIASGLANQALNHLERFIHERKNNFD